MAKVNKRLWYILGGGALVVYIFIAARPVPLETVMKPRWITSLESNYPVRLEESLETDETELLPFTLGNRYGYIKDDGTFAINRIREGYVSLSENNWAEYEALPSSIQVMSPLNELLLTVENTKGYPLFLDDRVFIVGPEQNSLTAIGSGGEELWTYDFPAPLTCVDAAGGFVLAGTLDGTVELLNSEGRPVFTPFAPGGSRLSVILGCAISRDAKRLAIISGIDQQRFLLMEHSGENSKVIHHEFISGGFRRPVHISFVDNGSRVAFEREGGMGLFDIESRTGVSLNMDGEIKVLDDSGDDRFLFVITSQGSGQKRFVAVRYPGTVVADTPFKSDTAFFARRDKKLYLGGDLTIASLELGRK